MNLIEIYLIASTIALVVCGVFWNSYGNINRLIKVVLFLLAILGGFLSLHAIGFALGVE